LTHWCAGGIGGGRGGCDGNGEGAGDGDGDGDGAGDDGIGGKGGGEGDGCVGNGGKDGGGGVDGPSLQMQAKKPGAGGGDGDVDGGGDGDEDAGGGDGDEDAGGDGTRVTSHALKIVTAFELPDASEIGHMHSFSMATCDSQSPADTPMTSNGRSASSPHSAVPPPSTMYSAPASMPSLELPLCLMQPGG